MKQWIMRNVKWVTAAAAVLVFMAAMPLSTEAGRRWSGMDPEMIVNDEKINIIVKWETGHECEIDGPIKVVVQVPRGAEVEFKGESAERFDCDGDGKADTVLSTKTKIEEGRTPRLIVKTKFESRSAKSGRGEPFRTGVEIYQNDRLVNDCARPVNVLIECRGPKL